LTAKTKAIIAAAVAIAFTFGLIVWQVKAKRSADVNITADDMAIIVKDFPPHVLQMFSTNEEARKSLANDIHSFLALAEEARANGMAKRPDVLEQVRLMRSIAITQGYMKKLQSDGKSSTDINNMIAPQNEIDAFYKEPGKEEKFKQFLKMFEEQGMPSPPPAEQLENLRKQWATFMIGEGKGIKAGIDKERGTQLQIQLQEAKVLAQNYMKQVQESLKATDKEIEEYIAKHPELDPKAARQKAEDILKRAKAGEDFDKLAKEFSEDPGSKEQGGDLGWFGKGMMVKPFEDAAFALSPGSISEVVESDFGYHIIKVEDKKTETKDGKSSEQVKARHILLSISKPDPSNPFAPPQKPQEKARMEVEKEKQEKLIDRAKKQHPNVKVATDFVVKAPDPSQLQRSLPPGMAPDDGHGHSPDDGHGHGGAPPPPPTSKGKEAKPKK
jgi:hypothetical protein